MREARFQPALQQKEIPPTPSFLSAGGIKAPACLRLLFGQTGSFRAAKCFTRAQRDLHGGAAAASQTEGLLHWRRLRRSHGLRRPKGMMPSGLPTSLTRGYLRARQSEALMTNAAPADRDRTKISAITNANPSDFDLWSDGSVSARAASGCGYCPLVGGACCMHFVSYTVTALPFPAHKRRS